MSIVKKKSTARLSTLDSIRGITLCSMIIYHFCWDLAYIVGMDMPWYSSVYSYIWQQSICWTFILLSGFCAGLSSHNIRRGLIVFGCGIIISLVTYFVTPESIVLFGILTFMGSAMIITGLTKRLLLKINALAGAIIAFALFLMFRDVNTGFLGFERIHILQVNTAPYKNLFTAYLGFPARNFYSSDYFSILPWIFLYFTGFYIFHVLKSGPLDNTKGALFDRSSFHISITVFDQMGRHSLPIYMLHQVVLYGISTLIIALQNR
ncbi:heparan-alpha-glucosaminide N-acetyltransferase [Butyrivibrio sp. MC2013]|uniref:heparan-alpha-glucosaminide N-acetyltransferase n=1 Tax=Butyrivibrio sp. MC2013 TaxID=1280686 RepID=UPI0003FC3256|nr:heparan-alpha-glucosaminide N-acetyltransferase [Butyrivibrio sp. MC2013]